MFSTGGVRIVYSNKGKPQLIHNGYLFIVDKNIGEKVHWRCIDSRNCRARIHTSDNMVSIRCSEHTHEPHAKKIWERIGLIE
ncbi:hypothetical protein PR048_022859 [Dryococelus australis]|uniref:FLYWCH-type domain-containing protein n=1 Tax=Dryococelus australis TaxID=614101 RepID=A0ABQ9GSF7_9NEOP|nr:hypothetical protein PR048_022859 [Dryococelus australis]